MAKRGGSMKIMIDIPDEQIEKCLEESKYIHEDEGEKGSVNIVLLYTNKKLEFVDISRKTDFYSLTDKYTVLPEGHYEDILDQIRAEIEEKYGECDICEYFEDYDYEENDISEYRPIGNITDILQIIDKYRGES